MKFYNLPKITQYVSELGIKSIRFWSYMPSSYCTPFAWWGRLAEEGMGPFKHMQKEVLLLSLWESLDLKSIIFLLLGTLVWDHYQLLYFVSGGGVMVFMYAFFVGPSSSFLHQVSHSLIISFS